MNLDEIINKHKELKAKKELKHSKSILEEKRETY